MLSETQVTRHRLEELEEQRKKAVTRDQSGTGEKSSQREKQREIRGITISRQQETEPHRMQEWLKW